MPKDVIIACDFPDRGELMGFLGKFRDERPFIKIGMELFYAEGRDVVRAVKDMGYRVFLDLKLHDIPNTVERSMAALASLDIDMVNVHAAGTRAMMQSAMRGFGDAEKRPLVVAVTQLTSTTEERMRSELLIGGSMENTVMHYAQNAKRSGLDGVVCSPLEVPAVREICGDDFLTVTPGVRLPGGDAEDQARITTPMRARELGSDYIVVGRPITKSDDPVYVYRRFVREFTEGKL